MDWNGKVCIITGASSGFGYETAKLFASLGATVGVAARREGRLKEVVEELGPGDHFYATCDVSDLDSVRALVSSVKERTDHVDVLVNNAGVSSAGPVTEATSEEMEKVIKVNLLGSIWSCKEFLPLVDAAPRNSKTPIIVNVASMAGRMAVPGSADYVASKFGLVGFTESMWSVLDSKGIRSMMVNPGAADTEGFPMDQVKANPLTAWTVMGADRVAKALVRGIEQGSFEVRVQWWLYPVYYTYFAAGPLRRRLASLVRGQYEGDF
jgi:NAD(P)-dependent dehydrogenase (short-subunit alcohol dehydrogenase family)